MSPPSARCSIGCCIMATCSSAVREAGALRLRLLLKGKVLCSLRGLCPRAPGIYRFPARMGSPACGAAPAAPSHSSRWVGAPVASLRGRILRPGEASINPHGLIREELLPEAPLARYNSTEGSLPWQLMVLERSANSQSYEATSPRPDRRGAFRIRS